MRGESVSRLTVGSRPVVALVFSGLLPRGLRHGAKDVGQAFVGKCLALFGSVGQRTVTHSLHALVCPKEVCGELLFFFLKKEPMDLSELVEFGPCVSAERVKACALIGLHVMAEENALRSDSGSSPDLGENVEVWLPKKALCGAATSGRKVRMLRLWSIMSTTSTISLWKVVGQNWSSEVISLFLEDWEVGRVALSCHLSMDLSCQEMRDAS